MSCPCLRLAQDRHIRCEYELYRDRQRAFSGGRLKLLENLTGPAAGVHGRRRRAGRAVSIASLTRRAVELGPRPGLGGPLCVNAGNARGFLRDQPHYSPGGVFGQDDIVRNILLEYYNTNADVLDVKGPRERVWELEFLTELFPTPGTRRPRCSRRPSATTSTMAAARAGT